MRACLTTGLAGLAALCLAACSDSSLTVHVFFDDVAGLETGDPVQVSGLEVGRVAGMDLRTDGTVDVEIEIEPKYRDRVTETSEFWLKRQNWISAKRHIELEPREGTPAAHGMEFAGKSGAGDRLQGWLDHVQQALNDPVLREKVDEFGQRLDEMAEQGLEEWEQLRPELEEHAERLLEEAERHGSEIVDDLKQEIEKLMEELEADQNEPIRRDV